MTVRTSTACDRVELRIVAVIGTYRYIQYHDPADAFRPSDPRCPEVARIVSDLIEARMPGATVEHVGSTSIPGCAGKGVVDLLLLYPPGGLVGARDIVDGLGFQRQTNRDPFPESRPLRVGSVQFDGEEFRLHVHVIAAGDPEAAELVQFRDRLRADPDLVAEYVAVKQRVLAAGVTDGGDYNDGKAAFIHAIIGRPSPAVS